MFRQAESRAEQAIDGHSTGTYEPSMETTIRCAGCGKMPPFGARYCPACGQDLHGTTTSRVTGQLPANHLLFKRYLVERTLARGGQSAVYLAQDTLEGGAPRAIKELSDSEIGRAH